VAQDLGGLKYRPAFTLSITRYDMRANSDAMIVARRYVIGGRVQGVGFRYFAEAVAAREGILGWVKNTPDGRVEVFAEGDSEAVERFERNLRHGPPSARVHSVDVNDMIPTGRETGFCIK
jgi:acylphosphatase